jgi:hypothetical protein
MKYLLAAGTNNIIFQHVTFPSVLKILLNSCDLSIDEFSRYHEAPFSYQQMTELEKNKYRTKLQ